MFLPRNRQTNITLQDTSIITYAFKFIIHS